MIVLARLQQSEQTMEEEDAAHILSKVTMIPEFVFLVKKTVTYFSSLTLFVSRAWSRTAFDRS